jgi:hypothetical protein
MYKCDNSHFLFESAMDSLSPVPQSGWRKLTTRI